MSDFRLRRKGIVELLRSRGVAKMVEDKAEKVAAYARQSAPVVSGTYKASIRAQTATRRDRTVGQAWAHVEYAQQVEAAHRVLGRAIDAARG